MDAEKKVVGFTALFEILMILKRELSKEKNDEMKYSHFLCTLERANQEKLKMAIVQLKCVPCLNKFTTNFSMTSSPQSASVLASMNKYFRLNCFIKIILKISSTAFLKLSFAKNAENKFLFGLNFLLKEYFLKKHVFYII